MTKNLGGKDNTPEVTLAVGQKLVQGIPEAIRNYSMQFTKKAMLSRGVSLVNVQESSNTGLK